jgi:ubiquinone/menaquinone biosynthesis C-methylase UbiE
MAARSPGLSALLVMGLLLPVASAVAVDANGYSFSSPGRDGIGKHYMGREISQVMGHLGAGTGYFSFPIAARLSRGQVLAVDIQPEMLAIIEQRADSESVTNIEPVLATEQSPNIPAGAVDLVLLVDAYHEFSYPREVMQGVIAGLRPGGRVVLVEYRGEDQTVPIKPLHKMTEARARRELEAIGFEFIENQTYLPLQHVLLFSKPGPD